MAKRESLFWLLKDAVGIEGNLASNDKVIDEVGI